MRSERYIAVDLERVKGRVKTSDTVTGLVWLLAAIILYLLVVIVVDQASPLERSVRLHLLWILAAAAALGLAVSLLIPTVKRVNDLYAARLIERQAEDLFRNSLVAYVELRDDASVADDIKGAVAAKAARDLRAIDLDVVVDRRPLRWATIALGAALALVALFAMTTPKSFATSFGRAVGFSIDAPTATRIVQVRPASGTTVTAGDGVTIAAVTAGRRPETVSVSLTRDGAYWDTLPMTTAADGRWTLDVANLLHDMRFRVRAGDAQSQEHTIVVQSLPAVTGVRTRLTYPSYTMRAASAHDTGNVEALVGTRVEIIAETNEPPKRPVQLVWADGERKMVLEPVPGTRESRGQFTVTRRDSYSLHFYDPATRRSNLGAVRYHVTALEDRPPMVEISGAAATASVPANGTLTLGARARDDYGLDRLSLGRRIEKSAAARPDADKETARLLATAPEDQARLAMADRVAVRVADLGLAEGDEASVWVAATDRRPGKPQEGRSQEIRVVIIAPESGDGGQGQETADGGKSPEDGTDERKSREGTTGGRTGDGGPSKVALTERQREDLQKMRDALENLRKAMGEGPGQPSEDPAGAKPDRQGDPSTGGAQADNGQGAPSQPEAGDGPAENADSRPEDRKPDDPLGERRTDFEETGRADAAQSADRQLLETLGPEMARLERDLSRGKADEKLLKELGWTHLELQRFVSEYKDRFGPFADTSASAGSPGPSAPVTPGELTTSAGGEGTVGGGLTTARGAGDDGAESIETRRRDTTSPRFADLLRAYRKAMSDAETPGR